jgi:TPR repeat protein
LVLIFVIKLIIVIYFVFRLKKSAKQKHIEGTYYLGLCYLNGDGIEKNIKQGIYYLKISAYQKNKDAQGNLFYIYIDHEYIKKDKNQAFYWLKMYNENSEIIEKKEIPSYILFP